MLALVCVFLLVRRLCRACAFYSRMIAIHNLFCAFMCFLFRRCSG
jgi:hypothetical protein